MLIYISDAKISPDISELKRSLDISEAKKSADITKAKRYLREVTIECQGYHGVQTRQRLLCGRMLRKPHFTSEFIMMVRGEIHDRLRSFVYGGGGREPKINFLHFING